MNDHASVVPTRGCSVCSVSSLIALFFASCLFAVSPRPAAAADSLLFKGQITGSQVQTNHIRAGCPGSQYGTNLTSVGPEATQAGVPSDFSCQVMAMYNGKLQWTYPATDVLAEIPENETDPATVAITNEPQGTQQVVMSGNMSYNSSGGGETHSFRVSALLMGQTGCATDVAEQNWSTTSAASKNMSAQANCALKSLSVVPGSVVLQDGKVASFRATVTARGEAEAGHEIPYPEIGFRGGVYQIQVVTEYSFQALTDNAQVVNPDPDPQEFLEPEAMQAFKADVNYDVVTKDDADLIAKLIFQDPDTGALSNLWESNPERVAKGSGQQHYDIPAVQLPKSGRLALVAELYEAGNLSNRLARSNEVIYEIANDFMIDHIEVVQAVQNAANTIPLVAGKSTVVRVFAKTKHPVRNAKKDIPMLLRGFRNGIEIASSPLVDMGTATLIRESALRHYPNYSYNFYLPKEWYAAGSLRLVADVNPDRDITEPTYDNNDDDVTVVFNTKPGMTVKYIPVCVELAGIGTECPEPQVGASAELMQKMYPVPDGSIRYSALEGPPLVWKGSMSTWENAYQLVNVLNRRYQLLAASGNAPDQLTAWIPDIPTEIGGLSDPFWLGNRASRVTVMKDKSTDDWWWNITTLAHEIGHNLGLRHPNTADSNKAYDSGTDWEYPTGTIQEHGWDVAARRIKTFSHPKPIFIKYDFMTYVTSWKMWVSNFHYLKLYNSSLSSPGTPAAAGAKAEARLANGEAEVAIISGMVRKDGTAAHLDPVYRLMSSVEPMASNPAGNYCLEFRDGTTTVLGSHCFQLSFRNVELDQDLEQDQFVARTALPAGTTRIVLVNDGADLASINASITAPTVAITSPVLGVQWAGGVQYNIAWTGTDADGDALTYSVLYSSDGGTTYIPLANDLTDTQYAINPAFITGGTNVYFRVLATDGFNTAMSSVGPITILQNPAIQVNGPINADEAPLGGRATVPVTITNSGTGPLNIQSITSDTGVFLASPDPAPLTVAAGSSYTFDLLYAPTQVGADNGTLTFTSNATNDPSYQVAVQGICTDGQEPALYVDTRESNIREVQVGEEVVAGVIIENRSLVDLDIQWTFTGNGMVPLTTETSFSMEAMEENAIEVLLKPTAAGDYDGMLSIISNDPDQPNIQVQIRYTAVEAADKPSIYPGGIGDAAQGGTTVSPGGIASVYGVDLAGEIVSATAIPLPTELGGVKVFVNGIEAPLYFVSPGQINFQIPFEAGSSGDLRIAVVNNGETSYTETVAAAPYAPAVFMNYAAGEPIVQRHSDASLVTAASPASPGDILRIYVTGIGDLTATPSTGGASQRDPLPSAVVLPTVTVGGVEVQVYYAGLTPDSVGLAQVDIGLPETLPPGNFLDIVISFPDAESNPVSMPVN